VSLHENKMLETEAFETESTSMTLATLRTREHSIIASDRLDDVTGSSKCCNRRRKNGPARTRRKMAS
jgi:hypothetical protein